MAVFKSRGGKIAAGTVVVLVAAGGGAAFAATELDSPSAHDNAIISDAAGQLGVQPSALSSALKKAYDDQIQAKVTSGEISQSQADALKNSVDAGNIPLFSGAGGGFGRGGGPQRRAPGARLRVRPRRRLERSRDLPRAHGRPDQDRPPGWEDARPDRRCTGQDRRRPRPGDPQRAGGEPRQARHRGKLSSDQEKNIETNLETMITNLVNGTHPTPAAAPFARRGLRLPRGASAAASARGSASARSAPTCRRPQPISA